MGLDMSISVDGFDILYWGKNYRLRNYFSKLNNFQDCGTTKLTEENVKDLLERCKKIKNDNSLVDKLLPFKDKETAERYSYKNESFLNYGLDYIIEGLEDILNNYSNSDIEYWESY